MAKSKSKRSYHKSEVDKVNKMALLIGGSVALIIIVIIVASSFMP